MNDLFTFEETPWEQALEHCDGAMTAGHFLALTEGESEDSWEDAFLALAERNILLDLTDLPKSAGIGEAALRLRQEEQLAASGDLLAGLEENDPLRLYLEELAGIPAFGDTEILAAKAAEGSESAREQLVNLSLCRVVELAKEYVGRGVLLLDLIQEGSMGLWQGILNYTGGDFEDHRDWWIRFSWSRLWRNRLAPAVSAKECARRWKITGQWMNGWFRNLAAIRRWRKLRKNSTWRKMRPPAFLKW